MSLAMSHHYKVDKKAPLKMKNKQTKQRIDESPKTDNELIRQVQRKSWIKDKEIEQTLDFSVTLHLSLHKTFI